MSTIHIKKEYQEHSHEAEIQLTGNMSTRDESQGSTVSKIERKIASDGIPSVSTEHPRRPVSAAPISVNFDSEHHSSSASIMASGFSDQPFPVQAEAKVSTLLSAKDISIEALQSWLMQVSKIVSAKDFSLEALQPLLIFDRIEDVMRLIRENPGMLDSDIVNIICSLRYVEQGEIELAKDKLNLVKDVDLREKCVHQILVKLLKGDENKIQAAVEWIIGFDKNILMSWDDVLQGLKAVCFKIKFDEMLIGNIFKKIYPSDITEKEKGIKFIFFDLLHFPEEIADKVMTVSEGIKPQGARISNLSLILYRNNYKIEAFELLNQLSYIRYPVNALVKMAKNAQDHDQEVKDVAEIASHINSQEVRSSFVNFFLKIYENKPKLNVYKEKLLDLLSLQGLSSFRKIEEQKAPQFSQIPSMYRDLQEEPNSDFPEASETAFMQPMPQLAPPRTYPQPLPPPSQQFSCFPTAPSLLPFPQQQLFPYEPFPTNQMPILARSSRMVSPFFHAQRPQQFPPYQSRQVQMPGFNSGCGLGLVVRQPVPNLCPGQVQEGQYQYNGRFLQPPSIGDSQMGKDLLVQQQSFTGALQPVLASKDVASLANVTLLPPPAAGQNQGLKQKDSSKEDDVIVIGDDIPDFVPPKSRAEEIRDLLSKFLDEENISEAMNLISRASQDDLRESSKIMQQLAIRCLDKENFDGAEGITSKISESFIRSSVLYAVLSKYVEDEQYGKAAQVVINSDVRDLLEFPQTIKKICFRIKENLELVVKVMKKLPPIHSEDVIQKLFDEYKKIGGDYQSAINFAQKCNDPPFSTSKYIEELALMFFRNNEKQKAFNLANRISDKCDQSHLFLEFVEKGSSSNGPITFEEMEALAPQIANERSRSLFIWSCSKKYEATWKFDEAMRFAQTIPTLEIKQLAISEIENTSSLVTRRKRPGQPLAIKQEKPEQRPRFNPPNGKTT